MVLVPLRMGLAESHHMSRIWIMPYSKGSFFHFFSPLLFFLSPSLSVFRGRTHDGIYQKVLATAAEGRARGIVDEQPRWSIAGDMQGQVNDNSCNHPRARVQQRAAGCADAQLVVLGLAVLLGGAVMCKPCLRSLSAVLGQLPVVRTQSIRTVLS